MIIIRAALKNMNFDLARGNLTPDQYFNFRQQLMAADPSVGNVGYKEAFPFSSGSTLQGIAGLMPGMSTIKNIGKAASTMLGGVPGDILSAGKLMGTDLRTKAGDVTGRPFAGLGQGIADWFKLAIKEKAIVVPFGLEKTVSYGGGTRNGPKEIIKASHQVELYDDELN